MEKKGGAPKGSKASHLGDPVSSSLRESRRSEGIYIEMRLSNIIFSEDQNIGSPSGAKEELIDSETFPRACITSESVTLSWDDVDVLSIALKNIEKMENVFRSAAGFRVLSPRSRPRENADKLRKLGHVELPFTVTTLDLNAATALRSTLTFLQGDTEVESNSSDSLSQTGQSRPLLGHQKRSLERSSPSPQRSAKILANESPHAKRIKSVSSSQQHASDGSQSPPRATNGSADGRVRNLDERETIPPRTEEKHTVAKAEEAEATQPKTTSALPKKFEKSAAKFLPKFPLVNDTLIELGLKYLLEDIKKRDPALYDSIYVFSSFFWKRFTELGKERRQSYELVKKWTAKVDIFSKKYLVIPINENLHWYLAIVINPHYILRKRQVGDKDKGKVEDEVTEVKEPGIATSTANERRLQNRPEHHLQGMDEVWTTPSDGMTTPPLDTLQGSLGQEAEIDGGGNEIDGDVTMNEADTEAEVEAADAMEVDDAVEVHKVEVKPSHRTVTTWDDVLPTVVSSTPTSPNASLKEVPVQDKRTRARASRSGPSDGLHNAGQGTMLGGGGGHSTSTPINAGDTIRRLREEDDAKERMEQEQRARAREAEEEREREAKVRGISSSFPIQAIYGDQGRAQLERKKSTGPKNPVVTERLRFNVENYTMILTFDSLGNSHKGVRTILRDYLCYEAQDKRQASFEDPKDIGDSLEQIVSDLPFVAPEGKDDAHLYSLPSPQQVACPAQDNYCDCGLFLLHFFERFFHDPRHMLDNVIIPRAKDHDSWAEEGTRTARKVWKERAKLIKQDFNERREKRCKEIRLAGQRNAEMSRSSSSLSPSAARSLSPSKALSPTESSSPLKARSVSKASPPAA
ncbi:hypothetical protein L7F22_041647 [Adiantum nelumboides]|nr:hypothetical protein [Adiantum nelumboides]